MESTELTEQQLTQLYAWPTQRIFRLNMVLDSSGSAQGSDGTSLSLTAAEDRRILRIIREEAQVVVIGAQSVRTEGWFLPPRGRLTVLSSSGNLPWDTCPDKTRVNVYPSISALVHSLTDQETQILCEGGLKTAEALAQQVGFDEIALTRVGTSSLDTVPVLLSLSHKFAKVSALTDAAHTMTFQFWRRAVEQQ